MLSFIKKILTLISSASNTKPLNAGGAAGIKDQIAVLYYPNFWIGTFVRESKTKVRYR